MRHSHSVTLARRPVPVLYLDLGGTVRHGKDELGRYVNGPDDVIVYPEAVEMMCRWAKRGGRIIGVSNQGGIALGLADREQVAEAMDHTHRLAGQLFDHIAWCHHHPDAPDPALARCWCRKPSPGLLVEATLLLEARHPDEVYPPHLGKFVGDRDEDRVCAELAGLDFQWAHQWRAEAARPDGYDEALSGEE